MKNALIIADDLSFPAGGPIYSLRIVRELCEAGWEVTVWTSRALAPLPEWAGAIRWRLSPAYFRHRPKLARMREERSLLQLVREEKPAVCLVAADRPRTLYRQVAELTHLVYFLHDIRSTCPQDDGLRFLKHSHKICNCPAGLNCLKVDRSEHCLGQRPTWRKVQRIWRTQRELANLAAIGNVVANSEYVASVVRQNCPGLQPAVLEPCVQDEAPTTASAHHRFKLLYLGRIETYKGILEAMEILALLPMAYRLIAVGTGDDLAKARRHAVDLGLESRVDFTGWQEGDALAGHVARAGVLVMPGFVAEAFGMAGAQALSAGLPVVAYDAGGVNSWCDGNVARCVPIGDRAAAAGQILSITQDESHWKQLSEAARDYARERFDPAVWRQQLFELIAPRGEAERSQRADAA